MADIFISYKSERRNAARHLARILELNGYSVWWDYGLMSGTSFGPQIEREIRAAKATVVLWCSLSRSSPWVLEEANLASRLGTLTPTWLERVDLPLGFALVETIDLAVWDGAPRSHYLDRLLREIARRVGHPPSPSYSALLDYEDTWRSFGAPPLSRFALIEPIAEREEMRLRGQESVETAKSNSIQLTKEEKTEEHTGQPSRGHNAQHEPEKEINSGGIPDVPTVAPDLKTDEVPQFVPKHEDTVEIGKEDRLHLRSSAQSVSVDAFWEPRRIVGVLVIAQVLTRIGFMFRSLASVPVSAFSNSSYVFYLSMTIVLAFGGAVAGAVLVRRSRTLRAFPLLWASVSVLYGLYGMGHTLAVAGIARITALVWFLFIFFTTIEIITLAVTARWPATKSDQVSSNSVAFKQQMTTRT